MYEMRLNEYPTHGSDDAEVLLIPEQHSPGHDLLEATSYGELVVDYARMGDDAAVDGLRYRLMMLGEEGDNAIDLIAELRSNYAQNVQPEERHLVVSFLENGTLRLTYLGLGDIRDESYEYVEEKLLHPQPSDLWDESGRGYFIMHQLSSDRGINRLKNTAGEHIGVELWFDVKPVLDVPDEAAA